MVVFNRFIQLLGRNSLYLRKSFLNEDFADLTLNLRYLDMVLVSYC